MHNKSLRLAACGLGTAAVLLATTAVPADAASTEGRQTITIDQCVIDEEAGLVMCTTATEKLIDVRTPSGRVIIQNQVESSTTTTHRGETTTDEGVFKSVNVYEWYVDGYNYGPLVIKLKGVSTTTRKDGMECTFETDFLSVRRETKFDHGSVTCAVP
ncbi:hypothetical protein [Arthrobacter sp. 754]|uniref:hypothetical protein n=1 Tax=Arthrobacter sp. 754 TaxID=3156315 RepID=UPI00339A3DEF